MDHGWSHKQLPRTIVTSDTYAQTARATPALLERDPRNRLLARGPRFRPDAEVVRDSALAVAGLLNPVEGGPSVFPPVPASVLEYNFTRPTYRAVSDGPAGYRRAVYLFRKRSMPDPSLNTLDAPTGDTACARRMRSNTPLAALAALNEPGLGGIALNALLVGDGRAAPADPLAPKPPHFAPKAKRVILLFQAGGTSHLDLFDHKPELRKRDGQLPPTELPKGYRAAFISPNSALLGPRYGFKRYDACGTELGELLPHTGAVADDLCLVRTVHTEAVNHAPAQVMMNTGSRQFGRPSFGAWTVYGLGSESADLSRYVVLTSAKGTSGGASNYGCGFLPTAYGGVPFRPTGDPVRSLSDPPGVDAETQRAWLDALGRLNARTDTGDPEVAARVQSYELAYRLQSSAPDLTDLCRESKAPLGRYGITDPKQPGYARDCLLARRLVERGTRFVQLFHEAWDQHDKLASGVRQNARDTDRACAALVADLKKRGLLADTLVVWGGAFGRTPKVQGGTNGRDHHNRCFSSGWLAAG